MVKEENPTKRCHLLSRRRHDFHLTGLRVRDEEQSEIFEMVSNGLLKEVAEGNEGGAILSWGGFVALM